jgi:hypothetical protein
MRPSKTTLFAPECAEKVIAPAVIVRVQRRLALFFLVSATQLWPCSRPGAVVVNSNVTLAASLSSNENVLPSGAFLLRLLM